MENFIETSRSARMFARVGGASMLALGLTALAVPGLSRSPQEAGLPPLRVNTSYGKFLGLFPLNVLNKSALLGFGIVGILSSRSKADQDARAVRYSRAVFLAMAPLSILGAIPRTRTLFGLWPLFGGEVAAHGLFAALGAYFGFKPRAHRASRIERSYPESAGHRIENRLLAS